MTPLDVKIFLLKKNLTIQGMASDLCDGGRSEQGLRVMLSQMINGHRFYPTLAKQVEERYGLRLARPQKSKTSNRRAA